MKKGSDTLSIRRKMYPAPLIAKSHRAFRRRDREFLHRLQEVIEQEYQDCDFGLARLAAATEISERQVQRKLKSLAACTPSEYLRNHRLQMALPYLREGEPIGETARKVGFASPSYFTSCFRAKYGCTPAEYQTSRGQAGLV